MRMVELGSVCEIKNGYAFKSSEFKKSGTPLIRISSFDNGAVYFDDKTVYVDSSYLKTKSGFKVEKGDVLIALSGATTGKYGIYTGDEPSLLNQRIGLLKSGASEQMNDKFFYYYLSVLKSEILRNAGGAAQPNISTKSISEFKIPLPPLDQQKKIASILDAADGYRQKTKALIEKYDALTQSLFLDMFGDPVTNSKGWEYKKLNELVSKLGDGIHGTPQYSDDGEYYFVNGNNLHQGKIFIGEKTKKVSEEEFLKHKKELNSNTVLVSINGTIGKVAFYNDEPIMLGKSACYFNLITGVINKTYLYYVIYSPYFLRYASNEATGSTIKNVSLKSMRNFPIPYPPLELQNQFAKRVQAIEAQKAQAQASLAQAEDLFNGLLQRAFKGELV